MYVSDGSCWALAVGLGACRGFSGVSWKQIERNSMLTTRWMSRQMFYFCYGSDSANLGSEWIWNVLAINCSRIYKISPNNLLQI